MLTVRHIFSHVQTFKKNHQSLHISVEAARYKNARAYRMAIICVSPQGSNMEGTRNRSEPA